MKKALFFLLSLMSFEAFSADWKSITSTDGGFIFVDTSTVLQVGKYRKAWILWDYITPQKTPDYPGVMYKSIKELDYYDCDSNQSAAIQELLYDDMAGLGKNVRSSGGTFYPWAMKDVAPDTVGQAMLKFVCDVPIKKRH